MRYLFTLLFLPQSRNRLSRLRGAEAKKESEREKERERGGASASYEGAWPGCRATGRTAERQKREVA